MTRADVQMTRVRITKTTWGEAGEMNMGVDSRCIVKGAVCGL